jgi:hypothetical protein
MRNDLKAVEQRESDGQSGARPGRPRRYLRTIRPHNTITLKYHRIGRAMAKFLFGSLGTVFHGSADGPRALDVVGQRRPTQPAGPSRTSRPSCCPSTRRSQTAARLPWSVMAAIGKVETDHGRSNAPASHPEPTSTTRHYPPRRHLHRDRQHDRRRLHRAQIRNTSFVPRAAPTLQSPVDLGVHILACHNG